MKRRICFSLMLLLVIATNGYSIILGPDTCYVSQSSGSMGYISIAALDETLFVIAYQDYGDGSKGKVLAGTASGLTITSLGSIYTFADPKGQLCDIAALDATHFVITYQTGGSGSSGRVVAGRISSGNVITLGTYKEFHTNMGWYRHSIIALDPTHFVIAFEGREGGARGRVVAGSVSSDTNVTVGSSVIFSNDTDGTRYGDVAALDATHFVIAYRDYADGHKGKVVAGTVSGVDITAIGSYEVFALNITLSEKRQTHEDWPSIAGMNDSLFVITYRDANDGGKGKAVAGYITSNTVINIDTTKAKTFESSSTAKHCLTKLNDSLFVDAFKFGGSSMGNAEVIAGLVLGTDISITLDGSIIYQPRIRYDYASALNDSLFIMLGDSVVGSFQSYRGKVRCGKVEEGSVGISSSTFYASADVLCVNLHWSVDMEDDCLLYIILKKSLKEDDDYYEIARISGAGSSPSPKTYSYRDEDVKPGTPYYYKLGVAKTNGNTEWYGPVSAIVTEIKGFSKVIPNPFTTSTTISFTRIGQSAEGIELKIYDMSGRLVKNLSLGTRHLALGTDVTWDGRDGNGNLLPSGIYLCTLELGGIRKTEKILLVR